MHIDTVVEYAVLKGKPATGQAWTQLLGTIAVCIYARVLAELLQDSDYYAF
jgi:hypothetical protein